MEMRIVIPDTASANALARTEKNERPQCVSEVSSARPVDDVLVLALLGEHDMATAPKFERAITEGLKSDANIVVDVSETQFLDSSILNALVRGCAAAEGRGQRFVLQFGTAAIVRRAFETSGLLARLTVRGSRAEAVAAAREAVVAMPNRPS